MSFMKKMFRRSFSGKGAEFTSPMESPKLVIPKDSLLFRNDYESTLSDASTESILKKSRYERLCSSSPVSSNSGPVYTSSSDTDAGSKQAHSKQSKKFNYAMKKYRRYEKKLSKKQKDVLAMKAEIEELVRMLRLTKLQSKALDLEKNYVKAEMTTLCNQALGIDETEIRKREPLMYKKYNAIKNANDCKSLVILMNQKQQALQNLEVLTYKKYMSMVHGIKTDTAKSAKVTQEGFEKAFQSIRSRMDSADLKDLFTSVQNEGDDVVAADTNNSTVNIGFDDVVYQRLVESTPV